LELPALVARVSPSVVSVVAGRAAEEARSPFSAHGGTAREHALGSGFLIAPDGLVLTSRHVIDGADDVRVELSDGRSFRGVVVGRDAPLDVALIRLEAARNLPVASYGSSDAAKVGDPVIAIGNPFGIGPSVTVGILSATARSIEDGPPGDYLQTDAAVNPGDSGGPLLDRDGRVIGINTAVLEHGHGISFAVPIDDVRSVLRELEATGRVARGHAGMSFQAVDAALTRALALPSPTGAIVSETEPSGPAHRAGLRPGDLITDADGRPMLRAADLTRHLSRCKPGQVVRFAIRRGACSRTISVLLDRLPNRDGDAERRSVTSTAKPSGVEGIHLVDADGGGARVESLDPESIVADGLKRDDVIIEIDHANVRGATDAKQRLHRARAPSAMLLRVRRDGAFLYLGMELR
jgi:serine protease Do